MAGEAALEQLIRLLAKLPGLGQRSARRAVLHMLKRRESLLEPIARALNEVNGAVRLCSVCGNLDTEDPCGICRNPVRDAGIVCVVQDVGDLWAVERTRAFDGRYHVLGGLLSALDGVGPDDLAISSLIGRAGSGQLREVILAMNATVEGQTTAHYIADRLKGLPVAITRLAHGVPVGGELDYLDEGTLTAALRSRRAI